MENTKNEEKIRLTQFSHGGGCGCKISPQVLEEILHSQFAFPDKNLLVGNSSKDDAAVYDLDNGTALISTTDFFMPILFVVTIMLSGIFLLLRIKILSSVRLIP